MPNNICPEVMKFKILEDPPLDIIKVYSVCLSTWSRVEIHLNLHFLPHYHQITSLWNQGS